jgi:hypothetical protein
MKSREQLIEQINKLTREMHELQEEIMTTGKQIYRIKMLADKTRDKYEQVKVLEWCLADDDKML